MSFHVINIVLFYTNKNDSSPSTGVIVGIILGILVLIALAAMVVRRLYVKRSKQAFGPRWADKYSNLNGASPTPPFFRLGSMSEAGGSTLPARPSYQSYNTENYEGDRSNMTISPSSQSHLSDDTLLTDDTISTDSGDLGFATYQSARMSYYSAARYSLATVIEGSVESSANSRNSTIGPNPSDDP